MENELEQSRRQSAEPEADPKRIALLRQSAEKDHNLVENPLMGSGASHQRFSTVFHKSPMAISITRLKDHQYIDANDAFQNITGFGREELIGHTPYELDLWIEPQEREQLLSQMREQGTVSGFEMRLRKKSGETAHLLLSVERIELAGEPCMLSMALEITERKEMEDALRQTIELQSQLSKIAATVPGMIYSFKMKPDGSVSMPYSSAMMSEIAGLEPEDVLDDFSPALSRIHPEDVRQFQASIAESAKALTPWHHKFRIRHPEKGEIWVEGFSLPNRESDGSVLWQGFIYDITDRQHAQEQLQRFVTSSPSVLYVLQLAGNKQLFTWASENLRRITSWDIQDAKREDWWFENIHADDRDRAMGALALPYEADHLVLEYRFRRCDGSYMWLRDERQLLRNSDGRPVEVIGTLVDISEQKRLEAQFLQAQKMEAIGVLAGGVAHDFNNLLTVINGYAEVLIRDLPANDPRFGELEQIRKAGQQATSLTSQLLAFSRKQILQPEILSLNDVLNETSKMLRRLIGEDVELIVTTQPELGLVYADPAQIQQIIMNLAINARDAMPSGGRLVIETANVDLDEKYAHDHPVVNAGSYVLLAISDNGAGMDAETQAHLFEPFFTTKAKGKGTGLGLSTVYGIVKQSNGFIWAYSEPGKGTTFKIYLPRAGAAAIPAAAQISGEAGLTGSETLLVVEDDPSVRALISWILRGQGYTVLEAANGGEALNTAREHAGEIHLVLTDVVMPGISGDQLVAQLRSVRPGIRSLYTSGYADDAIVHHGILDPNVAFLPKPFTAEGLARKVREILNG